MSRESDWIDAIKSAIERAQDGIHTAIPAKVTSYLAPVQQCAVEPVIDGMPPLEDVPVLWPRGGGYFLHFPIEAGDSVLLVFCERDFSPWRLSGVAMAPAILRRHGLFAYAIPGAAPDIDPLLAPAVLGGAAFGEDGAGNMVRVDSGGVTAGVAVGAPLPVLTAFEFTTLMATLVTWLAAHTHTGNLGAPTTPPVVPPTPPTAVGSAVLKVTS